MNSQISSSVSVLECMHDHASSITRYVVFPMQLKRLRIDYIHVYIFIFIYIYIYIYTKFRCIYTPELDISPIYIYIYITPLPRVLSIHTQ